MSEHEQDGLRLPGLQGKTVVVTGSTRGIGRSAAEALHEQGAVVVVNSRDGAEAEALAARLGGSAIGIGVDIAAPGGAKSLIDQALALTGRIDGLVNNAGRPLAEAAIDTSEEQWRAVLDLNLTATFLCAREAATRMLAGEGGAIVNVSSLSALTGQPGRAAYAASKGAVLALTRVLAVEWAPRVRVNALAPGYVRTELVDALAEEGKVDLERVSGATPLSRLASPREVGELAAILISDATSYVTGQSLIADGGLVLNLASNVQQ